MDSLLSLKESFNEIKDTRSNIQHVFQNLGSKIIDLKQLYVAFINRNTKTNFLVGLDSFYFQTKLIDIEHENMKTMFKLINNRMYCEYYKLHKVILNYINEHITDKKILEACKSKSEYPLYKDLEPYKEYDFDLIVDLHHDITQIIGELQGYLIIKERELKNDERKSSGGLNIDNFINTSKYNNALLKEQIFLFIEYLKVFHKYQNKYQTRFNLKLKLMYGQIQADITLEESRNLNVDNSTYSSHIHQLDIKPTTINNLEESEIRKFIHTDEDSPAMKGELNTILTSIPSASTGYEDDHEDPNTSSNEQNDNVELQVHSDHEPTSDHDPTSDHEPTSDNESSDNELSYNLSVSPISEEPSIDISNGSLTSEERKRIKNKKKKLRQKLTKKMNSISTLDISGLTI